MFGLLADIVSVFHYVWTGASLVMLGFMLVLSGILLFRPMTRRLRRWGSVGAEVFAGWCVLTLVTQAILGGCPLTMIENELRTAENPLFVPMESFLVTSCQQYLGCSTNPESITHLTFLLLGLSVVFLFIFVFAARVIRRPVDLAEASSTPPDSEEQ